jgi:hypothetical protein
MGPKRDILLLPAHVLKVLVPDLLNSVFSTRWLTYIYVANHPELMGKTYFMRSPADQFPFIRRTKRALWMIIFSDCMPI